MADLDFYILNVDCECYVCFDHEPDEGMPDGEYRGYKLTPKNCNINPDYTWNANICFSPEDTQSRLYGYKSKDRSTIDISLSLSKEEINSITIWNFKQALTLLIRKLINSDQSALETLYPPPLTRPNP